MQQGVFGKLIVILCLFFIIGYTVVITYVFYKNGIEPAILTPLVYSFFGGELVLLYLKKIKTKNNHKKQLENDGGKQK